MPVSASKWAPRRRSRTSVLLGLCCALGCATETDRRKQGEAVAVARQIDRLRDAENAAKRGELAALELTSCSDAEVCALKDLCVRAYTLHQEALDEIASLHALAASPGAAVASTRERLGLTEQKLVGAKAQTEECAREQTRVVRRFLL
jgi:hypothetical protein